MIERSQSSIHRKYAHILYFEKRPLGLWPMSVRKTMLEVMLEVTLEVMLEVTSEIGLNSHKKARGPYPYRG